MLFLSKEGVGSRLDRGINSFYLYSPEGSETYAVLFAAGFSVGQLTQEEIRVGALIVDSGKEGRPISDGDFEYLKGIGELIGAAIGKTELTEQLIESYRKKDAMVKQTSDAFRNRITVIGTISRRIARLSKDPVLAQEAEMLYQEIQSLESHLEQFEKNIEH